MDQRWHRVLFRKETVKLTGPEGKAHIILLSLPEPEASLLHYNPAHPLMIEGPCLLKQRPPNRLQRLQIKALAILVQLHIAPIAKLPSGLVHQPESLL